MRVFLRKQKVGIEWPCGLSDKNGAISFVMIDAIKEIWQNLVGFVSSIPTAGRALWDSFSELPFAILGLVPVFFVFLSLWIIRLAISLRDGSGDETTYCEHPAMVQGDFRSLTILHALIWIPVFFYGLLTAGIMQGFITFDPANLTSQLIFSIPSAYISAGLMGFIVWNGVSSSEEVNVTPTAITRRHEITSVVFFAYATSFVLFSLLLNIVLLNFGNWIKLPLRNWRREIWLAGGIKPSGTDVDDHFNTPVDYVPAASIDSIQPWEPVHLRLRNMGHLTIVRRSGNPLELRYLIKFKQLRKVVEELTGNVEHFQTNQNQTDMAEAVDAPI